MGNPNVVVVVVEVIVGVLVVVWVSYASLSVWCSSVSVNANVYY